MDPKGPEVDHRKFDGILNAGGANASETTRLEESLVGLMKAGTLVSGKVLDVRCTTTLCRVDLQATSEQVRGRLPIEVLGLPGGKTYIYEADPARVTMYVDIAPNAPASTLGAATHDE